MVYQPVIIDIETTGFNPMAQEGFMGEDYDAQVYAVGLSTIPNWREVSDLDDLEILTKAVTDNNEYHLLDRLPNRVEVFAEGSYSEDDDFFFVGHNCRQFDFPYLGARFARKRLNGELINSQWKRLDTMRVAGKDDGIDGWYVSEDDYAEYLGIEDDDPYTGADMPDAFRDGQWDKINTHVLSDVEVNAKIFFERRELCMAEFDGHYDDVDINPVFVEEVDL